MGSMGRAAGEDLACVYSTSPPRPAPTCEPWAGKTQARVRALSKSSCHIQKLEDCEDDSCGWQSVIAPFCP